MNTHEILTPLADILVRVQGLVQLAQAEDWIAMEAAAAEYEQRVAILEDATYFKSISAANLVEEAKAIIAQIQTVNNELDSHTALERDKVASELRQITQSNKALEAYGR
jgi:Flagellar protein FliT